MLELLFLCIDATCRSAAVDFDRDPFLF